MLLWFFISSRPRCAIPQIGRKEFTKTAKDVKGQKKPPGLDTCEWPLWSSHSTDCCVCFSPQNRCFRANLAIAEVEMCKKCAMVADGDSWQWPPERWLGFLASSHLCPGSRTAIDQSCHRCHRRAGGRACRHRTQPGGRWRSVPLGSPPGRDCEQLRLEYPERMPTIRPFSPLGMVAGGMAGVIIISDLTIRNGWCYHLAEEWPIDQRCKAAGVNNDQLLSYDQLTPDCPEQSKQPEVSHKKRETKVGWRNLPFVWQRIGRIMQIPEWQSQDPVDRGRCM